MRWRIKIDRLNVGVEPNDPVIVVLRPDQSPTHCDLLKVSGSRIGNFKRSTAELSPWWSDPLSRDARVEEV